MLGNVYFAFRGINTAGAIFPFGKPDWLNLSCD